ncbi:MAG: Hpt domain-containing protein [Methylobacterium sp.]|jgi:HPt (histidine-containing phosphotransfer) domain-containing protein
MDLADETLIDRAHLDAQTFGDDAFAQELLDLFADQCRRLMPGIADAGLPAPDRADLAHTLKGSALGVGAARVAARAAETEDALRADGASAPVPVAALAKAVVDTLAALARQG